MTRVTAAERTLSFPKTPVLCIRLHLKHLLRNPVLGFASSPMSWFALTNKGIKGCVLFFFKSIAFKWCFKLESYFQMCCYLCDSEKSRAAWFRLGEVQRSLLLCPPYSLWGPLRYRGASWNLIQTPREMWALCLWPFCQFKSVNIC